MFVEMALYGIGAGLGGLTVRRLFRRLQLSKAKHPSLRGHARLSRRVARLVRMYEYDDQAFFRCDDAPDAVAHQAPTADSCAWRRRSSSASRRRAP